MISYHCWNPWFTLMHEKLTFAFDNLIVKLDFVGNRTKSLSKQSFVIYFNMLSIHSTTETWFSIQQIHLHIVWYPKPSVPIQYHLDHHSKPHETPTRTRKREKNRILTITAIFMHMLLFLFLFIAYIWICLSYYNLDRPETRRLFFSSVSFSSTCKYSFFFSTKFMIFMFFVCFWGDVFASDSRIYGQLPSLL